MKYIYLILFSILFNGCLYFNDRGVSGHLYDNCHSYYDENGEFVEICDENIIDYDEAQEGVIALKDEIKENINQLSSKIQNKESKSGIKLEELTPQEQTQLLQNNPQTTIKEEIELNQCPCK